MSNHSVSENCIKKTPQHTKRRFPFWVFYLFFRHICQIQPCRKSSTVRLKAFGFFAAMK